MSHRSGKLDDSIGAEAFYIDDVTALDKVRANYLRLVHSRGYFIEEHAVRIFARFYFLSRLSRQLMRNSR